MAKITKWKTKEEIEDEKNRPKPPTEAEVMRKQLALNMLQSAEKDEKIKKLETQSAGQLMQLADKEGRLNKLEKQSATIMLQLANNQLH